jgi:hypothetical protein
MSSEGSLPAILSNRSDEARTVSGSIRDWQASRAVCHASGQNIETT